MIIDDDDDDLNFKTIKIKRAIFFLKKYRQ